MPFSSLLFEFSRLPLPHPTLLREPHLLLDVLTWPDAKRFDCYATTSLSTWWHSLTLFQLEQVVVPDDKIFVGGFKGQPFVLVTSDGRGKVPSCKKTAHISFVELHDAKKTMSNQTREDPQMTHKILRRRLTHYWLDLTKLTDWWPRLGRVVTWPAPDACPGTPFRSLAVATAYLTSHLLLSWKSQGHFRSVSCMPFRANSIFWLGEGSSRQSGLYREIKVSTNFHARISPPPSFVSTFFERVKTTSGQSLVPFRANSIFWLGEGNSRQSGLHREIKVSTNFHAKIKYTINPVCWRIQKTPKRSSISSISYVFHPKPWHCGLVFNAKLKAQLIRSHRV